MNRTPNNAACNRKEDLMSYLYGEALPSEKRSFEQHLIDCIVCREELEVFSGVRETLQDWKLESIPQIVDVTQITRLASNLASCDRKQDLMAYLYQEASPTESKAFELHLKECGVCRAELKSFSGVREKIKDWELEQVPRIQVNLKPTFWQAVRQFFQVAPLWGRFAMAGACALALMTVLNLQVSVGPNGVTVSTGWRPVPQPANPALSEVKPQPTPVAPSATKGLDEAQVRTLMIELIKSSEARQDARLTAQLQNISTQLQAKNDAALVKAVSSLNREHRQHLMNVLQESDRHKAPDLLDLLGQAQPTESGLEQ